MAGGRHRSSPARVRSPSIASGATPAQAATTSRAGPSSGRRSWSARTRASTCASRCGTYFQGSRDGHAQQPGRLPRAHRRPARRPGRHGAGGTIRFQIGPADLTITVPATASAKVLRYSATLGGILTLTENNVKSPCAWTSCPSTPTPTGCSHARAATATPSRGPGTGYVLERQHPADVQRGVRLRWRNSGSTRPRTPRSAVSGPRPARRGVRGSKPRTSSTSSLASRTDHEQQFAVVPPVRHPVVGITSWSKAELWLYTIADHSGMKTQDTKCQQHPGRAQDQAWSLAGGGEAAVERGRRLRRHRRQHRLQEGTGASLTDGHQERPRHQEPSSGPSPPRRSRRTTARRGWAAPTTACSSCGRRERPELLQP